MDLEEVKIMIRSLVTSSQVSCTVRHLLNDFKTLTGIDMPLFGYKTHKEFFHSIPDTIQLGSGNNPEVFLVQSEKSAHVSELVKDQKRNAKLLHIRPRTTVNTPNPTMQDKTQTSDVYNIPKLVEAYQRNPPQTAHFPSWNYNNFYGRYKWCTLPYSHTCTNYCFSYEQNRIKFYNDAFYMAKVRDYSSWRKFQTPSPPLSRNSFSMGRPITASNRFNTQKLESKVPAWPTDEKNKITVAKVKEDEVCNKSATQNTEKDPDTNNNNSEQHHKIISESDKQKLKEYIKNHSKGATIPELLGLLAINKKNSQIWKKSVTANDIITSCSAFSIFKENRLFLLDTSQKETEIKHVPKESVPEITVQCPIKDLQNEKKIEVNIQTNKGVKKKKSSDIFEINEDLEIEEEFVKIFQEAKAKRVMSSTRVNDRVQIKLKQLIKNFPMGIWCCDLQEKYYDQYKSNLDYREFNCTSMIQMVFELPEIFRVYRPDLGDWILFDASVSVTEEEKKYVGEPIKSVNVPNCMKSDISKLLKAKCQYPNDLGVFIDDIPEIYHKMYRRKLDYESIGFPDLHAFLKTLEGEVVHLIKVENTTLVTAIKKKVVIEEPQEATEAIPPINPDDDLFVDLFPENVFGPNEKIQELHLQNFMEVGSMVPIVVAEVYSPHRFNVTLKQYESELDDLMKDLENFFRIEKNLDKYEMPKVTIQPKQICAAYYNEDKDVEEKWHRAEIVKSINDKRVSVNLIDYGTTVNSRPKSLRFLPREFGILPRQAILATLAHVQPPGNAKKWGEDSCKKFHALVQHPSMLIEVLEIDYKEPRITVNLTIQEGNKIIDLAECLIIEELADYSEEILAPYQEQNFKAKIVEKKNEEPKKSETVKPKSRETTVKEKSKTAQCSIGVVSPMRQDVSPVPPSFSSFTRPSQETPASSSFAQTIPSHLNSSDSPRNQRYSLPAQAQPQAESTTPAQIQALAQALAPSQAQVSPQLVPTNLPAGIDQLAQLLQTQMQIKELQMAYLRQQQLQQLQAAEEKKQINNLALSFLMTNADIKSVAENDLERALRLATNLAEAFYANSKGTLFQSATANLNFAQSAATNPTFPTMSAPVTPAPLTSVVNQAQGPAASYISPAPAPADNFVSPTRAPIASNANASATNIRVNRVDLEDDNMIDEEKEINLTPGKVLPLNITNSGVEEKSKCQRYVKEIKLRNRILHLLNLKNKPYFCAEQLRILYTPFSSWNIVEQILTSKKFPYGFEIITRDDYPSLFEELESYNSYKLGDSEDNFIRLLPLNKVTLFLHTLQRITGDTIVAFTELLEDFDPNDSYWTNP